MHDIEQFGEEFAMAYAGREIPWHTLGQALPEGQLDSASIARAAHLDNWNIQCVPATYMYGGESRPMGDSFAVVRMLDGKKLGTVGKRYHPFQNEQAFEALDGWDPDSILEYETAGSLRGGRRVFLLARTGDVFKVAGVDPIQPYILCHTSHDGSTTMTIKLVDTRVVCANTLAVAMREGGTSISLRHTKTLGERLAKGREALGLVLGRQKAMYERFNKMAQMSVTEELVEEVAEILLPKPKDDATDNLKTRYITERDRMFDVFNTSPTVAFAGGIENRWGLFNGVTEWIDWKQPLKGLDLVKLPEDATSTKRNTMIETRALRSLEGEGEKDRQKVFNLLVKPLDSKSKIPLLAK